MSDTTTTDATATDTTASTAATDTSTATKTDTSDSTSTDQQQDRPTETVEFWKQKAREQESRAKSNAKAAEELQQIKDANKTQAEKDAERVATAEATVAMLPQMVADELRTHLVSLHGISAEDAELFLTADKPDLLLKQIDRFVARGTDIKKTHVVPAEGNNNAASKTLEQKFVEGLFGAG